jgi:membrane associated rhomboid family serine protease
MSSLFARPPRHKPGILGTLRESFWIADVLVLGLLAFFMIVGDGSSTAAVVVGCVLALLYAAHAVRRHDRHRADALSTRSRRIRERRGF